MKQQLTASIRFALAAAALACALGPLASPAGAAALEGMPEGEGSYQDLVALFQEFLEWKDPARARGNVPNRDIAGAATEIYPDYGAEAVAARRAQMQEYQSRLVDMAVASWPLDQQVDYLAVRSRFDQHQFTLNVSRPWSRDPGFYVDQMLRVTFAELPLSADETATLRARLQAISLLVEQAMRNLTEVAADYAELAIFNLDNADGVGHGFPYRATPPPGVLGWYADFLERAARQQPELQEDIAAAKASVQAFRDWLTENRPAMTGQGGVGKDNFNWYLKHVKLMPYTTDQIVTLGLRELERLWSVHALEQHRNRKLPAIEIPNRRRNTPPASPPWIGASALSWWRTRSSASRNTFRNWIPTCLGLCAPAGRISGSRCSTAIPRPTICMRSFPAIASMAWWSATTPIPFAARSPAAPAPRDGPSIWKRG